MLRLHPVAVSDPLRLSKSFRLAASPRQRSSWCVSVKTLLQRRVTPNHSERAWRLLRKRARTPTRAESRGLPGELRLAVSRGNARAPRETPPLHHGARSPECETPSDAFSALCVSVRVRSKYPKGCAGAQARIRKTSFTGCVKDVFVIATSRQSARFPPYVCWIALRAAFASTACPWPDA